MKKLLSIAAAVCMSFTLVACGGNSGAVDKSEEEATAIVNGFLAIWTYQFFSKLLTISPSPRIGRASSSTGAYVNFAFA